MEIIDLRNTSRLWFINATRAARINHEKLKLLAPLLGVSPEDMPLLRQEDEKRQQWRIGAIPGTATTVLLAISALSIFALESRYRATEALNDSMFATDAARCPHWVSCGRHVSHRACPFRAICGHGERACRRLRIPLKAHIPTLLLSAGAARGVRGVNLR
jgi:hypothetical protein